MTDTPETDALLDRQIIALESEQRGQPIPKQFEIAMRVYKEAIVHAKDLERRLKTKPTEELPKPLFTEAMLFGSLVDWCHETFDLRAYGVSRMADNEQAILVSFSRKPSDDELRALHEVLAGRVTKPVSPLERRTGPVGWVVALEAFGENTYRVYGPQYRTREAAEQDADLPRKRGQKAQVWECHLPADPRPPMPEGCVGGCPPQQVCDHCQWPTSGKDEQSTPQHSSSQEKP